MIELPDLQSEKINLPAKISQNEQTVRGGFWPKMKKFMARVPFADKAIALYFCALDPETPLKAKGIMFAALAYFIMPIDVIPDVLAGLGFTDDMAVIAMAIAIVKEHIKPEHYQMAKDKLQQLEADPS